jgi:branched-chain amino acid transport system ATP-binding protein
MMSSNILQTEGLCRDFGGLRAVRDLDIAVPAGEIQGLIGPNGSGKTTLLNVVSGYLTATAGSVLYDGEALPRGLAPFQIAQRGIVRTFQITSIFASLTAEENVISAQHLRSQGTLWGSLFLSKNYRQDEKRLRQRADEILAITHLQDRARATAAALSAGEQRHLEIAIALAAEPKLLLLDEPGAGLNPEEQSRLMTLIQDLNRSGLSVLLVEHAMKVVMGICHNITVLNFGTKIAEGTPSEIANDESVIKAYLGSRRGA